MGADVEAGKQKKREIMKQVRELVERAEDRETDANRRGRGDLRSDLLAEATNLRMQAFGLSISIVIEHLYEEGVI